MKWYLIIFTIALVISTGAFVADIHSRTNSEWYRAAYTGARQCYREDENPYKVKEENKVFYPSRESCIATLRP